MPQDSMTTVQTAETIPASHRLPWERIPLDPWKILVPLQVVLLVCLGFFLLFFEVISSRFTDWRSGIVAVLIPPGFFLPFLGCLIVYLMFRIVRTIRTPGAGIEIFDDRFVVMIGGPKTMKTYQWQDVSRFVVGGFIRTPGYASGGLNPTWMRVPVAFTHAKASTSGGDVGVQINDVFVRDRNVVASTLNQYRTKALERLQMEEDRIKAPDAVGHSVSSLTWMFLMLLGIILMVILLVAEMMFL